MACNPWGQEELGMTEQLTLTFSTAVSVHGPMSPMNKKFMKKELQTMGTIKKGGQGRNDVRKF